MEMDFEDERLRRLATDQTFSMGLDRGVVKAFRMRIQIINAAPDERVFYKMAGWRFEKLKGDLSALHSIRLNKQWRLLVRFEDRVDRKVVVVVSIVDYH